MKKPKSLRKIVKFFRRYPPIIEVHYPKSYNDCFIHNLRQNIWDALVDTGFTNCKIFLSPIDLEPINFNNVLPNLNVDHEVYKERWKELWDNQGIMIVDSKDPKIEPVSFIKVHTVINTNHFNALKLRLETLTNEMYGRTSS